MTRAGSQIGIDANPPLDPATGEPSSIYRPRHPRRYGRGLGAPQLRAGSVDLSAR